MLEELDVKNLMALGKLLILTATLASVVGCSSTPYQSESVRSPSVTGTYDSTSLLLNFAQHIYLNSEYGLTDAQKTKQNAAVYTALESDYGQVFYWYERTAKGAVKAVHGYPQGSGFCRVVYSQITVKGKTKDFEETACREAGHEGWRFILKR